MNKILIFFLLLTSCFAHSQDTIFLDEVPISKNSFKKSKVITFKKKPKERYSEMVYDQHVHYQFHKFSFPTGQPLELTLYFTSWGDLQKSVYQYEIEPAQYELDLFEVRPDGRPGKRLTTEPLILKLEGGKKSAWQKVNYTVPLENLNLFGSSFYIRMSSSNSFQCPECHHFYPIGEHSDTERLTIIRKEDFENGLQKWQHSQLDIVFKMKVLTNEY